MANEPYHNPRVKAHRILGRLDRQLGVRGGSGRSSAAARLHQTGPALLLVAATASNALAIRLLPADGEQGLVSAPDTG